MPFTIGGDYIPKKQELKPVRLKVETVKGKQRTCIENLNFDVSQIKDFLKDLKKCCNCGGTIIGSMIVLQGNHKEKVSKELNKRGIKFR